MNHKHINNLTTMKKTIIAMMALAGVAMGETYTFTPLTDVTEGYGKWSDASVADVASNAF